MYFLGVLFLLSVAVALPTPEQLHTNFQAPPPPHELKSAEKDKRSAEITPLDPIPPPPELPPLKEPAFAGSSEKGNSDESKKSKEEKDEDKNKPEESTDSKESNKPLESQNSKELNGPKESKESKEPDREPKESKEENKNSKSDELLGDGGDDEDEPILLDFDKAKPSGLSGWLSHFLYNIQWPFHWPSFLRPQFKNHNQRQEDPPIYVIRESDFYFN